MARFPTTPVFIFALMLIFAGCRKGPDEPCEVETSGEQGPCGHGLACYKGKCASLEDVSAASSKAKQAAIAAENEGKHDEALRHVENYGETDGWGAKFPISVELVKQFDAKGIAFVKTMDELRAVNNAAPDTADEVETAAWKMALEMKKKKAKDAHAQVMESTPLVQQAMESCPDNELAIRLVKVLEKKPNTMELLIVLGYRYQSNHDVDLEFLRKALEEARSE